MKLYRMNSLFELELSKYPETYIPSKLQIHLNHIMQYFFLAVSSPEDRVIMSQPVDPELIHYWNSKGLDTGKPIYSESYQEGYTLTEWGRIHSFENGFLAKDKDKITNSIFLNSKLNQSVWKNLSNLNSVYTYTANNIDELNDFFNNFTLSTEYPIFIRSEFGFSGIGSKILNSKEDLSNYLKNRKNQSPWIIEEWIGSYKTMDFSSLFEYKNKTIHYIGSTQMMIDSIGQYLGSVILNEPSFIPIDSYSKLILSILEGNDYEGFISIDGYSYLKNDKLLYQFISEINFRYSMSGILFTLFNKLCLIKKVGYLMRVPKDILKMYQINTIQELSDLFEGKFGLFNIPITPIGSSFVWILIYS